MAPGKQETQPTEPVNVAVLAEHYQKTFEIAYENWKERNKLFVLLVLTAGVGLLLLLRVPTADALLVAAITKFLNITDQTAIANLQTSFPFDILLSIILVVMFYQMQRLYSTNMSVMRIYAYLGELEKDIQPHLGLPAGSPAFTREGKYYWGRRSWMQGVAKYYYVAVLFIILVPFIVAKLTSDFSDPNWLVIIVDLVVSIMIVLSWFEYARSAVRLDKPKPAMTETHPQKKS
jgi:hypothetical protein